MRPLIVIAAAVVALAAVGLSRLGQTLGQLGAIEAPLSLPADLSTDAGADVPAPARAVAQSQLAPLPPEPALPDDGGNEPPPRAAIVGDEHILRALASDPDFARAAEELLNDPDPQTQAEARQLLRELGAEKGTDLFFPDGESSSVP